MKIFGWFWLILQDLLTLNHNFGVECKFLEFHPKWILNIGESVDLRRFMRMKISIKVKVMTVMNVLIKMMMMMMIMRRMMMQMGSNEWSAGQSRVSQSWHPHIVLCFQSWLWWSVVIIRTTRSIMMIFFAMNNYQSYDAFEDGYELCSCNCLNMFIVLLKSRDPFQQKRFWDYRFRSVLVKLMKRDSHICWKCVQVILEAALMGTTQKSAVVSQWL